MRPQKGTKGVQKYMQDIVELFHKYKQDVYRLAVSYTHSKEEAEDVSQTVFMKLMECKSITPGKEKAWLMKVTANQCRSLLRSSWWKKTEELDEEIVYQPPEQTGIMESIHKLKPNYKVVIYLFYYEEYSTKEIAQILGIRQSTVTTRLARAREELGKEWKEE